MGRQLREWRFQLVDVSVSHAHGGKAIDDDSGQVWVCNQGRDPDSPTVYTDKEGTTLTETEGVAMQTFTNGKVHFWTEQTVTALDVYWLTAKGEAGQMYNVAQDQGFLPVNPGQGAYLLVVPFTGSDNVEADTGADLAANLEIEDVQVEVVTIDAGATVNIGILAAEAGGDANGFMNAVSVATAGFITNDPATTAGGNETYLSASPIGALLGTFLAGTDAATDVGTFVKRQHKSDGTAKSLSYTGSAADFSAEGFIRAKYSKFAQA